MSVPIQHSDLRHGQVYRHRRDGRHLMFIWSHPDDGACLVVEEVDREDGDILHFESCERSDLELLEGREPHSDTPDIGGAFRKAALVYRVQAEIERVTAECDAAVKDAARLRAALRTLIDCASYGDLRQNADAWVDARAALAVAP